MRTRQAQFLLSDVYALLDEVTGTSTAGANIGVKPAASDGLEWLNQEWTDLYDHLIDADTKWNLQQSIFTTSTNVDSYGFSGGAWCGGVGSVAVTAGGTGWGASGALTATGGGGSGFAGTWTATAGIITSAQVTNPGLGYTSAPTIAATGAGTGATLTPTMAGAHYKTHGVDVQVSGGAQPLQWFPAHRFQFEQRNQYNPSAWSWPQRIMYDVWGGTSDPNVTDGTILKFVPPPPGGFTIRHWWYPAPQRMVNLTDAIDGVNGAEQALVFGAAALAALQSEAWELADRLEQKRNQKWQRIVSTLRDRNIGEAPMARVVRGRPSTGFGRVGRWWGGGG